MKIEFTSKIKELIDGYHANGKICNDEIKAVLEQWKNIAIKNNADPSLFNESIREGIAEAQANAQKVNIVFNQKLKAVVEVAKKQIIPGYFNNQSKPTDYAARIGNALQFLTYQLDDLDDEKAYMILKDFVDDYDQMKLFKNLIEKHNSTLGGKGIYDMPKTFGKLIDAEFIMDKFNEIESISNMLFLYPKVQGETVAINNCRYSLLHDTYDQLVNEGIILELTNEVEKFADSIPDGIEN